MPARNALAETTLHSQDITIDTDSRTVYKGQEPIALKPMEYALLCDGVSEMDQGVLIPARP